MWIWINFWSDCLVNGGGSVIKEGSKSFSRPVEVECTPTNGDPSFLSYLTFARCVARLLGGRRRRLTGRRDGEGHLRLGFHEERRCSRALFQKSVVVADAAAVVWPRSSFARPSSPLPLPERGNGNAGERESERERRREVVGDRKSISVFLPKVERDSISTEIPKEALSAKRVYFGSYFHFLQALNHSICICIG